MVEYRPKHQAQLGAGIPVPGMTQGARDCGPRATSMGIDFQTRGQLVPGIRDIREEGGVVGPVPVSIRDMQRAVASYRTIRGRRPLQLFVKDYIGDVKAAMNAGKYVLLCIDYGRFNDLVGKSGDSAYRRGHMVGVVGERWHDGHVEWLLFDALDDHRRPEVPRGPRWVKRMVLVESMEAYARREGRCWAGVMGGGQPR